MLTIISIPPRARRKLSALKAGRNRLKRGFSLVEVVIALAIVAFALVAMLGVMSTTLLTHQDASVDSVFTLMTESAMQETRNVGFVGYNPGTGSDVPLSTSTTYYIYFDAYGQITADGTDSATPAAGTASYSFETTTTAANQATYPGIPLTALLSTANIPNGTLYLCTITVSNPTLATGSTSTNVVLVKMVFSWPVNAPTANQKTRTVVASFSNTN